MYKQTLNICELKKMVCAHFKGRYKQVMFHRLLDKLTPFQWWRMLWLVQKAKKAWGRKALSRWLKRPTKRSPKLDRFLLTAKGKLLYWFWRAVSAVRATLKLNPAKVPNVFLLIAWIVALLSAEIGRLFDAPTEKKPFIPIPKTEIGGCARSDSLIRPLVF